MEQFSPISDAALEILRQFHINPDIKVQQVIDISQSLLNLCQFPFALDRAVQWRFDQLTGSIKVICDKIYSTEVDLDKAYTPEEIYNSVSPSSVTSLYLKIDELVDYILNAAANDLDTFVLDVHQMAVDGTHIYCELAKLYQLSTAFRRKDCLDKTELNAIVIPLHAAIIHFKNQYGLDLLHPDFRVFCDHIRDILRTLAQATNGAYIVSKGVYLTMERHSIIKYLGDWGIEMLPIGNTVVS